MQVQHLTDLAILVQTVDQRDRRRDCGPAAAPLGDRHPVGVSSPQHHMDRGIQPGGHDLSTPLGFHVELAELCDRCLGPGGAAPGPDGLTAVDRDTAALQLGSHLRVRHPPIRRRSSGRASPDPGVLHRQFRLLGRQG